MTGRSRWIATLMYFMYALKESFCFISGTRNHFGSFIQGIVLFQWYMEVAIRCEDEMSSVERLYMQCVDGRSSVDGESVGLKDYQTAL